MRPGAGLIGTSLGTASTTQPAASAAAMPTGESSTATQRAVLADRICAARRYGSAAGFRLVDFVAANGGSEVVASERVERNLDQRPFGRGHQRGRNAGRTYVGQELLGAGAPLQAGAEQLGRARQQEFVGAAGLVGVHSEFFAHQVDQLACMCTHHGCARGDGKGAAEFAREIVERDLPDALGVQQGAVHIEEHRIEPAGGGTSVSRARLGAITVDHDPILPDSARS